MTIAIKAENLSKLYKVYSRPVDILHEFVTGRKKHAEFWALRNISFELHKGEMIAFVGRNGAGKSTLLKIIAGTLDHSGGDFQVNGRVASILELGTGFNPEYTGRENVKLGGLCLGLSKQEIAEKMDWIIEFSELGDFIDRPFKVYSSGMQARLTFATASCIEPEVLIVDEALSVGDIKFQVKCFDRLREYRERGGTILLVSHDLNTINTFCDRAYFLERGEVVLEGEPREVTKAYYNALFSQGNGVAAAEKEWGSSEAANCESNREGDGASLVRGDSGDGLIRFAPAPSLEDINRARREEIDLGNSKARIVCYGLYSESGEFVTGTEPQQSYYLHVRLAAFERIRNYRVAFLIRDGNGASLFGTGSNVLGVTPPPLSPGDVQDFYFHIKIPKVNKQYLVTVAAAESEEEFLDVKHDCLVLHAMQQQDAYELSSIYVPTALVQGDRWSVGE